MESGFNIIPFFFKDDAGRWRFTPFGFWHYKEPKHIIPHYIITLTIVVYALLLLGIKELLALLGLRF